MKTWGDVMLERLLENAKFENGAFILPEGWGDERIYAEAIRILRERKQQAAQEHAPAAQPSGKGEA